MGSAFGSSLGRILVPNNAFGQIGVSTALGILGQDAGLAIASATTTGVDLEKTIDGLISTDSILAGVGGQGLGAISAYLLGDLFNDIGITGAPAQIVQSLAGQTIGQIASNLVNEADGVTNPATNAVYTWDDGINIGTSLENIVGGFVGSEVADAIFTPDSVEGSEGAAVGSAVGGVVGAIEIGSEVFGSTIPGIGTAIGVLVGDIVGGLIGDLFGESHVSHIAEAGFTTSVSSSGALTFDYTTWSYQNGPLADATSIGEGMQASLNAILATVGGTVTNSAALTQFGVGVNDESGSDAQLLYYYDANGVRTQYYASDTTLTQVLDYAEARELSEMVFSGGDPYTERAIDAALRSSATPEMQTVNGYIQVAEDYEAYEANQSVINALIEAEPTSNFSASWLAEMAVMAQMGLGTSVQGSTGNDTLAPANGDNILIGGGGNDIYDFARGNGNVTIVNGAASYNFAEGTVDFTNVAYGSVGPDGVDSSNITFSQNGADLVINIANDSADTVTLEGWFAGSFAQVSAIQLSGGGYVLGSAIDGGLQGQFTDSSKALQFFNNWQSQIGIIF